MDKELKALKDRLMEKAEAKRNRARKEANTKIEAEFLEDMRSIERLMALDGDVASNGEVDDGEKIREARHRVRLPVRTLGPTAAAREAIGSFPTDFFTVRDVDTAIQRRHGAAKINRAAISSALNKLTKMREIEVAKKSQGREPGTYRRLKLEVQPSLLNAQ
jgi:hypothetical protein